MAGALIHVLLAFISALVVHQMHYRKEFSLAVFIGNLVPDALKFGISAIVQGSVLVFKVEQDILYQAMAQVTSSFEYWISMLLFALAVTSMLYHHKVIRKKDIKEINELAWFFIFGIIIHLITDIFTNESGPWY